jgi:hypothetical protein
MYIKHGTKGKDTTISLLIDNAKKAIGEICQSLAATTSRNRQAVVLTSGELFDATAEVLAQRTMKKKSVVKVAVEEVETFQPCSSLMR